MCETAMRLNVPIYLVYLLLLLGVAFEVRAIQQTGNGPDLTIVGTEWSAVLSKTEKTPYSLFFDEVTKDAPVTYAFSLFPIRRANRRFFEKRADCVYIGVADANYYRDRGAFETYRSKIFNVLKLRIFSPKDRAIVGPGSNLGSLSIAASAGLYNSAIGGRALSGNTVVVAESISAAFDLLDKGRADVVAAYDDDAKRFFESTKRHGYRADSTLSLASVGEVLVCWPGQASRLFIDHVNTRIDALALSGELFVRFGFSRN